MYERVRRKFFFYFFPKKWWSPIFFSRVPFDVEWHEEHGKNTAGFFPPLLTEIQILQVGILTDSLGNWHTSVKIREIHSTAADSTIRRRMQRGTLEKIPPACSAVRVAIQMWQAGNLMKSLGDWQTSVTNLGNPFRDSGQYHSTWNDTRNTMKLPWDFPRLYDWRSSCYKLEFWWIPSATGKHR